jgi:hypothetical protein
MVMPVHQMDIEERRKLRVPAIEARCRHAATPVGAASTSPRK